MLDGLDSREGDLYRIEVRSAHAEPRVRLREDNDLDDSGLKQLVEKLDRLDSASWAGNWTRTVLRAIERHPNVAAATLAERTGLENNRLKRNVRKLKDFA